jgi:hypothetical protein
LGNHDDEDEEIEDDGTFYLIQDKNQVSIHRLIFRSTLETETTFLLNHQTHLMKIKKMMMSKNTMMMKVKYKKILHQQRSKNLSKRKSKKALQTKTKMNQKMDNDVLFYFNN